MKISIVTINFNNLEGLKDTVSSVLKQEYSDIEYLIIDGGSTDGSKTYIESLTSSKIKYKISEHDNGLYDAMNKGLSKATGNYILFLNSGDKFFKSASLTHIVNAINNTKADVIYGSTLFSYENGFILRKPQELGIMANELPFCHQSVVLKTSLAKKRPFDTNLKFIADYDMFYRIWKQGYNFKKINNIISIYDANGTSASEKNQLNIFKEKCIAHNVSFNLYAYKLYKLKNSSKDLMRKLLPLKLRNYLLGRNQSDLNIMPLEYYIKNYN